MTVEAFDVRYAIEVMQAWRDGKSVQFRRIDGNQWYTVDNGSIISPSWNWQECFFRVADPERFYCVIPDQGDMPSCYESFEDARNAWGLNSCHWHGWLVKEDT